MDPNIQPTATVISTLNNTPETVQPLQPEPSKDTFKLSKQKTVLLTLGILIFIMFIFTMFFPVIPFIVSRVYLMQPKYKSLTILPVTRTVMSISEFGNLPDYQFENLSFRVPWKEVTKNTSTNENILNIRTPDNKSVTLLSSQQAPSTVKVITSGQNSSDLKKMQAVFGPNSLTSDYEFEKAVLNTSPAQVSLLDKTDRATGIMILSVIKGEMISYGMPESGIYVYDIEDKHIFQFGDPSKGIGVGITLYDAQDRPHQFAFKNCTQEEIDFILSSIKVN